MPVQKTVISPFLTKHMSYFPDVDVKMQAPVGATEVDQDDFFLCP